MLPVFAMGALVGMDRLRAEAAGGTTDALAGRWAVRADVLSVALGVYCALPLVVCQYSRGLPGADDDDRNYEWINPFATRVAVEAAAPLTFVYWLEALTYAGRRSVCGRLLSSVPFQKLGDWSYGIYCIHMIVIEQDKWGEEGDAIKKWWATILIYVGLAAVVYELLEKRLIKLLSKALVRPKPPPGTAVRRLAFRGPRALRGYGLGALVPDDHPLSLACPLCIPADECVCFNVFNPAAGCGNSCEECRAPCGARPAKGAAPPPRVDPRAADEDAGPVVDQP